MSQLGTWHSYYRVHRHVWKTFWLFVFFFRGSPYNKRPLGNYALKSRFVYSVNPHISNMLISGDCDGNDFSYFCSCLCSCQQLISRRIQLKVTQFYASILILTVASTYNVKVEAWLILKLLLHKLMMMCPSKAINSYVYECTFSAGNSKML